jgi:NAD(P)-dependent dehydrogenase (short-subunit alcohol dehydrogenase family)
MSHFLVVGATSGLGLAYSRYLLARNIQVSRIGGREHLDGSFKVNLESAEETRLVLEEIVAKNGLLDCIVFCQRFRSNSDVNPLKEYMVNSYSVSHILENSQSIFNPDGLKSVAIVSSLVSSFPDLNSSVSYQATKGALNSISRFYALKLARFGIRVNSLSPFFFVSDRNKGFYNSDATWQDFVEKRVPLSRNFQIEELFPKLDFLLSADSSFITGQNLTVDGGATLRIYP